MIDRYYQEELARLKELAADFAAAHPALAPMLAGPSSDPDVERLLEGVAFQNGLLRQRLDDDFPELIHDLARLVCPQYLRPLPAATIVAFSPAPPLNHSHLIPAGTEIASVPIDGTRCLFRTCSDVELHPLEIRGASFAQSTWDSSAITVSFTFHGNSLQSWAPKALRLFLAAEYPLASELYFLLRRHLIRIVVEPEDGGRPLALPPDCLQAGAFGDEALFPYPSHAFPGHRPLQEYFALPQRFLFLDLVGWERWVERGNGPRFTVRFELSPFSIAPPRVKPETFALFATPAVNLFSHDADPILLDHRKERYLVRPAALPPHHVQIFCVEEVKGYFRGGAVERTYRPFETFRRATADEPVYHAAITPLPCRSGFDLHLAFPCPVTRVGAETETVSIQLTCTNAPLPERLRIGDVCHATAASPECATFRNITPVAPGVMPPLGKNLLWRLVSHLSLNHISLASAEKLRAILALYLFEEGNPDQPSVVANRKRVEGIEEVTTRTVDRLVRRMPVRGTEVTIRINGDHFAGTGDLFLFGSVLDHFLAGYASLNTFTRLIIHDTTTDRAVDFPPRLGEQALL